MGKAFGFKRRSTGERRSVTGDDDYDDDDNNNNNNNNNITQKLIYIGCM